MVVEKRKAGASAAGGSLFSAEPPSKRRALAMLPALPTRPSCATTLSFPTETFEELTAGFQERQERRDAIFASVKGVGKDCERAVMALLRGQKEDAKALVAQSVSRVQAGESICKSDEDRNGAFSGSVEACVKASAMLNFFETGRLLSKGEATFAKRQEYLSGIMGFTSELQRYAVLRGTEKDVSSLFVCKRLVDAVNAELMLFDWKNGPLRHKYDSIKYVVRQLEDKLFELSLQEGVDIDLINKGEEAVGEGEAVIEASEFAELRKDMEEYDEKREMIIKQCRDMQKGSKNSIYMLHRGDLDKSEAQLKMVKDQAEKLLPLLSENESLRGGSFSNAMEEYAEGLLFLIFLKEGRIATSQELEPCTAVEYVGGLLDLTGEVGRYAVKEATKRNVGEVQKCQAVIDRILSEFMGAVGLPGGVGKKLDQCKQTLRKMDNMLYELSLSRKSAAVDEAGVGAAGGGESADGAK